MLEFDINVTFLYRLLPYRLSKSVEKVYALCITHNRYVSLAIYIAGVINTNIFLYIIYQKSINTNKLLFRKY